jgi:cytochrome c-type biogenesis protein
MLASASQTVARGAALLGGYSLGLGLPFVGTAAALGLVSHWLKKLNKYMNVVSIAAGVLLIVMGILLITGLFQQLNAYLLSLSTPA